MSNSGVNTVGIIGTGLIGGTWAAYFLSRGLSVRAWDPATNARSHLDQVVKSALADLRVLRGDSSDPTGDLIFCDTLADAVTGSDYIQENGPEKLDLKQSLIAEIDRHAAPHVIIGSSTSSLKATDLQVRCRHPERVLVAHPFNPSHLLPLVELVRGAKTSEAVQNAAAEFFERIGKVPVRVQKEVVGHVANRMAAALWREAVHIVAEGVASVEDVDRSIRFGPGLRWAIYGPHMLYHLGGGDGGIRGYLEHLGPAQEARWQELGSPRLTEPVKEKIISGIEEEAAGKSVTELQNRRDRLLVELLKLLNNDSQEMSR